VATVNELVAAGWVADVRGKAGQLACRLGEDRPDFAPRPMPVDQPPEPRPPASASADELIGGREREFAAWVQTYRDEHGHGPRWDTFCRAHGWPTHFRPGHHIAQQALRALYDQGWLAGLHKPCGMRSGPRAS
jgi:hypothetical protein